MISRFLILLVDAYAAVFRPVLGARCRFAPSCSDYAREALHAHGAARGVRLALTRLSRCHPFNSGGFDPVPHG